MVFPNTDGDVNLLNYWKILKKYNRLILVVTTSVTVFAICCSLLMPKYYLAEAVIMPINNKGGGGVLSGQLGGLASLAGISGSGASTPSQQFMALLKTRTLAEVVINEDSLLPVLLKSRTEDTPFAIEVAAERLRSKFMTFVEDKKGGTIKIRAEFKDPVLAAKIANDYVAGLQKFISGNSFTVAKRNRIFIEKQLSENKLDLLMAGKELNEFYKNDKVSNIEALIDVLINKVDDVEDSSGEKLVVTDGSLGNLIKESAEVEKTIDGLRTAKAIPQQVYLQYMTLRRTLLAQINSLLTQQYEMAKIEEAKDELAFQVIDPARVPGSKSRPKGVKIVFSAFFVALSLSTFLSFFLEYIRGEQSNPKTTV